MTTINARATKKWTLPTVFATLLALAASLTLLSAQPAHATVIEFDDPVTGISYRVDDADPTAGATAIDYDPP